MATVIFRIRKGVRPTANINVRFKNGDEFDFEVSSKIPIPRNLWSNNMQRVKNSIDAPYKDKLNKKLNDLRAYIMNSYYDANVTNTKVSQIWLKQKVGKFLNKSLHKPDEPLIYFSAFIEDFIEESRKPYNKNSRKPITERTISTYETTLLKLKDFEHEYGLKLKISDINLSFHSEFVQFLSNHLLLNPNTIGGYISRIKLFCNSAEIQGLDVSKEVKSKNFYCPQNETKDIYLNEQEIEKIFNHKFEVKRLDNARDWLVICCNTALRSSDLLSLSKENIVDGYIHKQTFKTKTNVVIPIHNMVQSIIEKYQGNFPKAISEQKLNQYLKDVCREVGLTELTPGAKKVAIISNGKKIYRKQFGEYPKYELVSTHIGRRSFATNNYGKVSNLTIMKITGHVSHRIFETYLKKSNTAFAEEMKRSWER